MKESDYRDAEDFVARHWHGRLVSGSLRTRIVTRWLDSMAASPAWPLKQRLRRASDEAKFGLAWWVIPIAEIVIRLLAQWWKRRHV